MSETPITPFKETPVLRPADFRTDAYFFYPQNRDYLSGQNEYLGLKVAVHTPYHGMTIFGVLAFLGVLGCLGVFLGQNVLYIYAFLLITALITAFIKGNNPTGNDITQKAIQGGTVLLGDIEASEVLDSRPHIFGLRVVYVFRNPIGKRQRKSVILTDVDFMKLPPATHSIVYLLYFSDKEHYLL